MNRIKNILLCIRYPFLRSRNVWTGKKLGFKYTWLDSIPDGWRKAFGKELCRDLKKAIKKDKAGRKFRFLDIKEKWGSLCIYTNCHTESIARVLDYYELISMAYCINCGKPVRYITNGWITYVCEDCYFSSEYTKALLTDNFNRIEELTSNINDVTELFKENRLTKDDIPVCDYSDPEMQKMFDAVDWKKLWDLED